MMFPFYISPDLITEAFNQTRTILNGNEPVLFNSMHNVHPAFTLPNNPTQFLEKNREIDRLLSRRAFSGGMDLNFKLADEVLHQVLHQNIVVDPASLTSLWSFPIQERCVLKLLPTQKWMYSFKVSVSHLSQSFDHEHALTLRDRIFGRVVPDYIVQYFHTALNCFEQHLYSVCLALSSIIIEGTLKDVLITRNYTFDYANRGQTNYIGGLGKALQKARTVENVLTPADLPEDLDDVIKPIRNNLVHLSGVAFNTQLPYLNHHNNIPNFTLGDFVKDPILVHDLLQSVSYLVDKMYIDLRTAGHLIS